MGTPLTGWDGLAAAAAFGLGVAAATWLVTRWVTAALVRRAILDEPNRRSSHSAPTPRGGGLAVMVVVLPLWAAALWLHAPGDAAGWAVIGAALALAAVSWADDLRDLSVTVRLLAHAAAVTAALALAPAEFRVFQGWLPLALDRVAAGLVWLWFINLFNFMDGIDGLAGVETAALGLGAFALAALHGGAAGAAGPALALQALIVAAAAGGFLVFNWHPARVFLGDVGSIPLGYLLGWLLLTLAMWGYWAAALILPAYYLADATVTILRRAWAGEPVWRAHAEHFYQRAVRRGFSHARVARFVAIGNVALAALALASSLVVTAAGEALCLAGAALVVAVMLGWLARATPGGGRARP